MKYLIAILLLCLPALAATKYPAYTDNANSTTFTGGATNFATVANLASLSNSVPAGTNTAMLNGTNTFTGTNSYTSTKTLFDSYSADTLTHWRVLYAAPTNIYINYIATNTVGGVEVNGAYRNLTPIFEGTLPGLSSSNSVLFLSYTFVTLTAQTSTFNIAQYWGTNTNYAGIAQSIGRTTRGATHTSLQNFFILGASYTNQSAGGTFTAGTASLVPLATNLAGDVSQPWPYRLGAYFTAGNICTNVWLANFRILERR